MRRQDPLAISAAILGRLRLAGLVAGLAAVWLGAVPAVQARPAPESFADLAEAKLPAVVTVTSTTRSPERGSPEFGLPFELPPGSPFRDFFEEFFRRQPGPGPGPGPEAPPRAQRSMGSGFIIDPAGYVVTNNHVVERAAQVRVVLHDDRELDAEVVGTDPKTDLALLKIDAGSPLPSLEWGDSDAVRVGDWALAIGNPFGLGGTVTAGIISARARNINAGPYDDFLQTDAAINRGNSGGPLFDMNGRVIGVNTAIFSQTGGNIGIGFAVPTAIAQPIITQLRETGEVTRGWLGVMIQPVTPEIAEAIALPDTEGALVANVTPDSPAAQAGVRSGDVIRRFNGQPIREVRELSRMVANTSPGQQAEIVVWRDGGEQTLTTQLARLEDAPEMAAVPGETPPAAREETVSGLTLAPLSPDLRRQFGIPDTVTGVVVMDVRSGSPAAERGFRPGDVITEVGQQAIERPTDLASAVEQARQAGRNSVLVRRHREGETIFVPLPVDPGQG